MKHTIEFDLPSEAEELTSAVYGSHYRGVLHEFMEHLMSRRKSLPDNASAYDELEDAVVTLCELTEDLPGVNE